jgi:hypothetical protein
MAEPKLSLALEQNIRLATSTDLSGTPAYLVGKFILDAVRETLTKIVSAEHNKLANDSERFVRKHE